MKEIYKGQYIIYKISGNPCLLKITNTRSEKRYNQRYNPNSTSTSNCFEFYNVLMVEGEFVDTLHHSIQSQYSGVSFRYNMYNPYYQMNCIDPDVVAEFPIGTTEEEAQIVFDAYKDKEREKA